MASRGSGIRRNRRRRSDASSELAPASGQLGARGSAGRAVREGKEKMRRNDRRRGVAENRSRTFQLDRRDLRRRRGEADRSLASAAITEAGALLRVAIGVSVMLGMTGHRVRRSRSAVRGYAVHDGVHRDVDRQPAVHDARVELHRLGQTDGEPDGQNAGETAEE
jgi:hypothetical protein